MNIYADYLRYIQNMASILHNMPRHFPVFPFRMNHISGRSPCKCQEGI